VLGADPRQFLFHRSAGRRDVGCPAGLDECCGEIAGAALDAARDEARDDLQHGRRSPRRRPGFFPVPGNAIVAEHALLQYLEIPVPHSASATGSDPASLARPDGAAIAYHRIEGRAPGIVFLGGFRSNMTGTKALFLEDYCRRRGRAYVRFDYFGHGGSSMGGWIMLLAALARPERVAALVGIAAAPDFTTELLPHRLTPEQRRELDEKGAVTLPSDYDPDGYLYTSALIEDGGRHLLLGGPIPLDVPVRLLHGLADVSVPWQLSQRLTERLTSRDVTVTLVKGGDHRLSTEADLARLARVLDGLT
jgi:pimeloyl-ACP methyl ester carboxylesterase